MIFYHQPKDFSIFAVSELFFVLNASFFTKIKRAKGLKMRGLQNMAHFRLPHRFSNHVYA